MHTDSIKATTYCISNIYLTIICTGTNSSMGFYASISDPIDGDDTTS